MFRGSSTQLYVPAFTQKDFHYIVHTGLQHREPLMRIWVIQTGSKQLLSPTIQPLTRGKAQYKSPLHLDGWALSQTMINLTLERFQLNHLSLEGCKHLFHNHLSLEGYQHNHLSLEGYHKVWKVATLGGLSQPQTNSFSQN